MKRLQSPFLVMPLWSAVGALLAASAARPGWTLVGALSWPLIEYAAHRWVMHGSAKWAPRFYRKIHGIHHAFPDDLSHFTIPIPFVGAVVAVFAGGSSALNVGREGHALLGGLLLAYVAYDLAHLAAHGRAPFPWQDVLARHHAVHHAQASKAFAVTVPFIDRIFRTSRSSSQASRAKAPPWAPGRTEALRVVIGNDERAVEAYRAAEARGGRVFAISDIGSPLACAAGDRNITDANAVMLVMFADEIVDMTDEGKR